MKLISLKHIMLSGLLVFGFSNLAHADYDECYKKAVESAKEPGKSGFFRITKFKAGYMVSTDVKNIFDKNKQREILELYYSYTSTFPKPEQSSNEELEMVGHSIYFADTCELIAESSTGVGPE